MAVGLGFLGCGSAFEAYARQIKALEMNGRVRPVAAYDPLPGRDEVARALFPSVDTDAATPEAVIEHPDVDAVVILTSIGEHADLSVKALRAGKHVLAEKPMAASLSDGARLLAAARATDRVLVCGPHVTLSPTFRVLHDRIRSNDIGRVLAARSRYGWRGPEWAEWYYKPGGGAIFDLGIYNLVSLCGLLGSVRRVAGMVGIAVESRPVNGRLVDLEVEDTAHWILDFGNSCFASMMTGNTVQNLRSPAIEVFGEDGVLQLLGEDYAPAGFERWHTGGGVWETHRETDPMWPWTDGIRHLIDCIELGTRPVMEAAHAYHVLEVALAITQASDEGRTVAIESTFPPLNYPESPLGPGPRFEHDLRIV